MAEIEVTQPSPPTVYGWLSSNPLAATAGNAVYNMYEGSKNYNCVTQYALGTVESSVRMASTAVAPVVKKLEKPIHAVDAFTASKLAQLEDKVPAVKSQPEDVMTFVTETKESLANKIVEGRASISTRFSESKDSLASHLVSGKEIVYSKLNAGAEVIVKSRAGVAVSEGKQKITSRIVEGKEAVGNAIATGRDAVCSKLQSGSEYLASTRAGCAVGSGVDHALAVSENWVEYLLPPIENENELFECGVKEDDSVIGVPRCKLPVDNLMQEDDSAEADPVPAVGRMDKVCVMSRKVKLRMYFHSMQRLQEMQQSCQATLTHLKQTVDLLKLVQATRDGMDKQYSTVTSALRDLEGQIKQLLYRQCASENTNWLPKDDDDAEVKIDWITPHSQGIVQSSLDYAKQLSEKVFHAFNAVTVATAYLPSRLRERATQGYQHAQEVYSTLKPVRTPMELQASSLSSLSSLLETQLSYLTQLGTYLSSVLKRSKDCPAEEENEETDEEESGSELEEPEDS